jgi:plastocyanin
MTRIGANLRVGSILLVVAFALSGLIFYGLARLVAEDAVAGETEEADGGVVPGAGGEPVRVTLVARDIKFDKRTITVAAGADVTVVLQNQDAGVLHNFAVYTNRAATQRVFVGEIFAGVATREESFKAPSTPGNYFFRCDVHPDTMTGTFVVR